MNPLNHMPGPRGDRDGFEVFHVIGTLLGLTLALLAMVAIVILLWNSFRVRTEMRALRVEVARLGSGDPAVAFADASARVRPGVNQGPFAVLPDGAAPPGTATAVPSAAVPSAAVPLAWVAPSVPPPYVAPAATPAAQTEPPAPKGPAPKAPAPKAPASKGPAPKAPASKAAAPKTPAPKAPRAPRKKPTDTAT